MNVNSEEHKMIRRMRERCGVDEAVAEATVLRLGLGREPEPCLESVAAHQGVTVKRVQNRVTIGLHALREAGFFETGTDLLYKE